MLFLLPVVKSSSPPQTKVRRIHGTMDIKEIKTLWRALGNHPLNKSIKQSIVDANITKIANGMFEMSHSLKVGIEDFSEPGENRCLRPFSFLNNLKIDSLITHWTSTILILELLKDRLINSLNELNRVRKTIYDIPTPRAYLIKATGHYRSHYCL